MNRCFVCLLGMLIGAGFLVGGCATTGDPSASLPSYDPNKPKTFLPGAEVQYAKSVAMGAAVSKGWKVVDSSENRLLATRPLNAVAAQSLAGEPVSTASVEVGTDFFQRQGGVEVVVGAALIADSGTEMEKRIDFTESYRDELNSSLSSLSRAWEQNRQRVTTATPPLPTKMAMPADGSLNSAPNEFEGGGTAGPAEQTVPPNSTGHPWAASETPVADPVARSSAGYGAAPVEDRSDGGVRPPPDSGSAVAGRPANDMLVLSKTAAPGVWAYYAEHYAKIHGCEVSEGGAVLEEKTPEHEVHRVYCEGGESLLVSCNAGTCRGIQ